LLRWRPAIRRTVRFEVPTTDRPHPRNAGLAGFFSFLFPGLGQAYAYDRRSAVVFAAPVVLLVLAVLLARLLLIDQIRNDLFSSGFLTAVLIVNIGLMGWRLIAIAHAALATRPSVLDRRTPRREVSLLLVAILLVTTVGMHAAAGSLLGNLNSTLADVFGGEVPGASGGPGPGPVNQPEYRWNGTSRINFLLLGIDSGEGR
jgi:hypothetical protein